MKYLLLPTTFSVEIFFVENMFEMLALLAKLGISVIPVCFTSDRKRKDCSTIHSRIFFRENIVVEFSRTNVVALCHKQLIRRHLHILAASYNYVNKYKVIAPCHVTYTQQKQHCLPFWKRHITALSTRNAI